MNMLFSLIERIAIGPEIDPLDRPIIDFRNGKKATNRDMMNGLFGVADKGTGKTTMARTLHRAMLREGYGGLVLCVKRSQVEEFLSSARAEGREEDCHVLTAGGRETMNPLAGETNPNEAADLIGELAEVLAEKVKGGGENDAFWRAQLAIILRNLFTLCWFAYHRLDVIRAAELFDDRANHIAEISDPRWQETSRLAAALRVARISQDVGARLAVEYFEKSYPAHGDRLQGSLAATVGSVFDYLRRPPLREIFSGESTFSMNDLLTRRKIAVVGLPALDSVDGRIANALTQFCFCRSATRSMDNTPTFIAADECQELVNREFMRKMALLREFRVATVLLTQNLAVLDEKIGETAREGLCALMSTKVFGHQSHEATRKWATEQIGERKMKKETKTTGRSEANSGRTSSTAVHEQWEARVPPSRFSKLAIGETICLREGQVWQSRWHKDSPGKRGTVAII
jgi:type IV secretory pathway TraG/TraD family ATPase VirD4